MGAAALFADLIRMSAAASCAGGATAPKKRDL